MLTFALLIACANQPASPEAAPTTATPTEQPAEAAAEKTAAPAPAGAVSEIDVKALNGKLADIPILVDVRTPGEYSEGHVPGAVNIPLDELPGRVGELEQYKEGEVHLVCRSGARSSKAAQLLAGEGYQAVNVAGGTLAWQAAGYAVE
jgi:rhodanese-related sulfurtransferase